MGGPGDSSLHQLILRILSVDPSTAGDLILDPGNTIDFILEHFLSLEPSDALGKLIESTIRLEEASILEEHRESIFKSITLAVGLILVENDLSIFTSGINESSFQKVPIAKVVKYISDQYELADLKSIFDPTIGDAIKQLNAMDLIDNVSFITKFFYLISQIKDAGPRILVESKYWNKQFNSQISDTILGALLSVSSFASKRVMQDYFNPNLTVREMDDAFMQLRNYSKQHLETVHNIIKSILHVKDLRSQFVLWITKNVFADPSYKMRSSLYHQIEWEKSLKLQQEDGFHLNLGNVLLMLCMPFVKTISSYQQLNEKLKLIEHTYCIANSDSLGLQNEPWVLLKDQEESTAKPPNPPKEYGFVASIFFTTHMQLYKGLVSSFEKYNSFTIKFYNLRKKASDPSLSPADREALMESVNRLFSLKLTMDCYFLDPETIQYTVDFFAFSCYWIERLIDTPEMLNYIPEFFLTNCSKYFIYTLQTLYSPGFSEVLALDPVVPSLYINLLGKVQLKNPHLKDSALETLMYFSCPHHIQESYVPGVVDKLGISNPVYDAETSEILIPSLIQLYIDVERSDSPNSYYQKFYTRDRISKLLRYLENIHLYARSFKEVAETTPLFLSFMRVLISDATFHLDELVAKLPKLKDIEKERAETNGWANETPEMQAEHNEEYTRTENIIASSARFSNESIDLLHFFSGYNVEALKDNDLSERIATILNYFLWYFAGPNRGKLAIDQKDKLQFKPRLILKLLVQTFIHFHEKSESFEEHVVKDGRFQVSTFTNALQIIKDHRICNEKYISKFHDLIGSLSKKADQISSEDIPLDEIPEEFLDPLMYTMMENPVTLPSGMNMDKQVITRYLETNLSDPFTRKPLTVEQLVENSELKAKIAEWKQSRK